MVRHHGHVDAAGGACCSVDGRAVGAVEVDWAGTGAAVARTGRAVAVGRDGVVRNLRRHSWPRRCVPETFGLTR